MITTNTINTSVNLNEFWSVPNPGGITVSFFLSEVKAIGQAKLWASQSPAHFPIGSTNKSDWGNWIEPNFEVVSWGNLATQRTRNPKAKLVKPVTKQPEHISDTNAAYNEQVELNSVEYLEFCETDIQNYPRI